MSSTAMFKQLIREVIREEQGKMRAKHGSSSRKKLGGGKSPKKDGDHNRTAFSKTKLLEYALVKDLKKLCDLFDIDDSGKRLDLVERLKRKMTRENFLKLEGIHGLGKTLESMFQSAGFKLTSVEYDNQNDYRFDVVADSFRR